MNQEVLLVVSRVFECPITMLTFVLILLLLRLLVALVYSVISRQVWSLHRFCFLFTYSTTNIDHDSS